MELNYALDTVRKATYHDARFFSEDFREALQVVMGAAGKYHVIQQALKEQS